MSDSTQLHNHALTGKITVSMMDDCPACLATMAEQAELVRLASQIYKERLSYLPFYQERLNDEHFWSQYVGSRIVQARTLVQSAGLSARA